MVLAILLSMVMEAEPPPELKALIAQARSTVRPHQEMDRFRQEWEPTAKAILEHGEQATPLVLPMLQHPSPGVRVFFGYVAARLPGLTPREFPSLLAAYRGGNSWVMPAIASIDAPAVREFLIGEFLANPEYADFFVIRLGERAVEPLIKALRARAPVKREFGRGACGVFKAAAESRDSATHELLAILENEQLPIANRVAGLTLIGCMPSASDSTRTSVDSSVRASKSLAAQREVLELQRTIGTPDGITRSLSRLAEHPEEVRYLAFGGQAARRAEPEVLRLIEHERADLRLEALQVLGAIGGETSITRLVAFLTDPRDWRAPCAAARALAQLKAVDRTASIRAAQPAAWFPHTAKCLLDALQLLESGRTPEPDRLLWERPERTTAELSPALGPGTDELDERGLKKINVAGIVRGLGEKGLVLHNVTGHPVAGLRLDGGVLVGTNRGEWEGELVFLSSAAGRQLVIEKNVNVVGLHRVGSHVVAVTGLAHLSVSEGALYRVDPGPDGRLRATEWRVLPGAPEKSAVLRNGRLFVSCTGADIVIDEAGTIALATPALIE